MLIRKISTSSVMLEYKFIEKFDIGTMTVSQYSVWLLDDRAIQIRSPAQAKGFFL
jgi:hypothetical protein